MLSIRLWLPLDVRPGVLVVLAVLAGAEVVAQSWSTSTKGTVVGPGCILCRRHGQVFIAVVEAGPVRPAGSALSVPHVVHLVGADGYVDIRTLVLEDVLHATPFRSVSAILRPDESLVGLDAARFLPILDPGSVVSTVFLNVGSVWHDGRVKYWEVMGHG